MVLNAVSEFLEQFSILEAGMALQVASRLTVDPTCGAGAAFCEVAAALGAAPVLGSIGLDAVADLVDKVVFEMVALEVEVVPVTLEEAAVNLEVVAV